MYLKCYAGDTAEFKITNLLHDITFNSGGNFGDWSFIFTAKESLSDSDISAKIQRNEAHGITLNAGGAGSVHLVSIDLKLVHADTVNLQGKTLYCDIQGYNSSTGEVSRFAYFRLRIDPAVTRQTTTSITVNS